MPTVLDAAGVAQPQGLHGVEQQKADGISLVYSFNQAEVTSQRNMQIYEMTENFLDTSDWYSPTHYRQRATVNGVVNNPAGPAQGEAYQGMKVQKGGSFLCTDQYCARYRPGARGRGDPDSTSNHIGFRLVKDDSKLSKDKWLRFHTTVRRLTHDTFG